MIYKVTGAAVVLTVDCTPFRDGVYCGSPILPAVGRLPQRLRVDGKYPTGENNPSRRRSRRHRDPGRLGNFAGRATRYTRSGSDPFSVQQCIKRGRIRFG